MKVVFMNRLEESWQSEIEKLKREFPDSNFITFKDVKSTRDEMQSADVAVTGHISPEEIEKAENLKAIIVPWAGVNMLPWKEINEKKIKVANTHANASIVAERAIALCLAMTGKVVLYHNDLSRGIWHGFSGGNMTDDLWTSIRGKTCGIIGLGSIGLEMAKLLKGFDCKIVGFKKHPMKAPAEKVDEVTNDLEEVISKSEFIFVALPLTEETENLIDWDVLSRMKGKFLINISRGTIVSQKDLYNALKEGILAGAAIDVWYDYPLANDRVTLPSSYPIHDFPNVVLSPHVSGLTVESLRGMVADTLDNVRDFLKNGEFRKAVDPDLKY